MSIATDSPDFDITIPAALRTLPPDTPWVADVIPLLRRDSDTPDIRYAFVLIMAESVCILADLIQDPSADTAATLIAEKVQFAIDATGVTPASLIIRGEQFADAVQHALPHLDIEFVDTLADIFGPTGPAFIAESLRLRHAMDGDSIPHASAAAAPLWRSWHISPTNIAAFFSAAAAFYRAASTRGFSRDAEGALFILDIPTTAQLATGSETIIMCTSTRTQSANIPESVTLYADPEDWNAMIEAGRTNPIAAEVRHPTMTLYYGPAETLDPDAVAEIHTNQWEIAAPTAYPRVWFLNTIAGGLTTIYLHAITTQLAALARALAPSPGSTDPQPPLSDELILRYTDRLTGIAIRTAAA